MDLNSMEKDRTNENEPTARKDATTFHFRPGPLGLENAIRQIVARHAGKT